MIATIMIVMVRIAMMIEIRNVVIKMVVVVMIRAHDLIKDMMTVATKQSMMIDDKTQTLDFKLKTLRTRHLEVRISIQKLG